MSSFRESLTKTLQEEIDKAVKAALEERIPLLAKEFKVDEKDIRKILDMPVKKTTTTFTAKKFENKDDEKKEVKKLPIFPEFDDEKLYVVTDYTEKSFAIFGETATKAIKKKVLEPLKMSYNTGLAYGKGFCAPTSRYDDFQEKLEKSKQKYKEMTRAEMEKMAQKIKNEEDEDLATPATSSKDELKKKLAAKNKESPKEKSETVKQKVVKKDESESSEEDSD